MKRTLFVAALATLALAGCKKKEGEATKDKPAEPAKPVEPAPPAPPPPPFTGALTIERVLGADQLFDRSKGNVAWAEGLARAEAQLGKATKVDGAKYQWAVIEGDDCAYYEIEKADGTKFGASGDIVGMIQKPMKVGKDGPSMNRADCRKIAGVEAGPPEDPNAAGPPADGSAVSVDDFRGLLPARSKWKDQVVKVRGHVKGVSTSSSGSDKWVLIQLLAAADDPNPTVSCAMATNAEATAKIGDEVIATGKVEIAEMMSMGSGEVRLEPKLVDCTTEPAPAAKGKGKGK